MSADNKVLQGMVHLLPGPPMQQATAGASCKAGAAVVAGAAAAMWDVIATSEWKAVQLVQLLQQVCKRWLLLLLL
jgi:hypothetical protein